MYKGIIWCRGCDETGGDALTEFVFEAIYDIPNRCSKCGCEDIFFQQLDWGNDKDDKIVKTGNGGCGGYRRA